MQQVNEIDTLIKLLAKIPGLGPRSARRAALYLISNSDQILQPLSQAMQMAWQNVKNCQFCGNLDVQDPCNICSDPRRDETIICVVEGVSDLWALERTASYQGRYHILGGVLSPLDGRGPEELSIDVLVKRASDSKVTEVVLATSATVDGKTTGHYITDCLTNCSVSISELAQGIPLGGELDFLDEGTLIAALKDRRAT